MPKHGWTEEELYLVRERAHSLYLEGKHAEAAVILAGAVALDPEDRYSRYALATVCLALGRPLESIEQLDVLIARDRGDIEARARRCEALLDCGDIELAARELAELRHMLPSSATAQLEMRVEAAPRRAGF